MSATAARAPDREQGRADRIVDHTSWPAIGTTVHVLTIDGSHQAARRAVAELIEDVDRTYSRFRPDSELSRLNARPGRATTVSPLLAEAIGVALRAARVSEGLVDPTVGRALRLVGYDADFARIAARTEPLPVLIERVPGWRALRFDAGSRTVRLPAGVELDLGSTGKALAADLAAEAALRGRRGGGVLVSLGGDIALAGSVPEGGWNVLAAEDSATPPDAQGELIALHDGALATSSTTVRRWQRGGVHLHHLIDPRTGLPAESPWRTASVIAASCVDANIAATASIIRGADAPEWLAGFGLAARLVSIDGAVVRVGAWPVPHTAMRE